MVYFFWRGVGWLVAADLCVCVMSLPLGVLGRDEAGQARGR